MEDVSAFKETGSPSWEGFVVLVCKARSRSVGSELFLDLNDG